MQYADKLCAWGPGGEHRGLFLVRMEGREVFECGWRGEEDAVGFDGVEGVVCALYCEPDAAWVIFCRLDGAGEENIGLQEVKGPFV